MPQFLIRVELHSAEEKDYETLHVAMAERKFSRTILSLKRVEYHLPPAEYVFYGEVTSDEVCHSVMAAAGQTGLKFAVLMAEAKEITWYGLEATGKTQ